MVSVWNREDAIVLIQKSEWNASREVLLGRNELGPIPDATRFLMGHAYRYEEPTEVHGWQWSTTFGTWSALVTFKDGWKGYTYPEPKRPPAEGASDGACALAGPSIGN
jgi:hypothetical protein